jgi:diguanylate cyclase (GGDEF)-like protein
MQMSSPGHRVPEQSVSDQQVAEWLNGAAAQRSGDLAQGLGLAEQAWSAARAAGLFAEQVEAGYWRAHFLFRRGESAALMAACEALLPLMRELGPSDRLCELLRWLSMAASDRNDFELALQAAQEGVSTAHELADARARCLALNALGVCFNRMGDPWQAERLMKEAAALLGERAGPFESMVTQNNLARVSLDAYLLMADTGREPECAKALERGLAHAQAARPHALALDEPFALAVADGNRAKALLYMGRLDEAEPLLQELLAINERHGHVSHVHGVRCALIEVQLARGQVEAALAASLALLQAPDLHQAGSTALHAHRCAYRAAKALGRGDQALHHLEQCHALDRGRGVVQLMAQARFFVSRLEAQARLESGRARDAGDAEHDSDPLTGLGNRAHLAARMPALVLDAELHGTPLTLALIDVDRFKPMRLQRGLVVADAVLRVLAEMLRKNTRANDLLLRWNVDQFLVVLPDTVPDRAFEVCERIRQAVEAHDWTELDKGLDVTLSIGLANPPPYATDLLVERAESAMLRAKHLGRNRVALA